jgi:hypothetical protein
MMRRSFVYICAIAAFIISLSCASERKQCITALQVSPISKCENYTCYYNIGTIPLSEATDSPTFMFALPKGSYSMGILIPFPAQKQSHVISNDLALTFYLYSNEGDLLRELVLNLSQEIDINYPCRTTPWGSCFFYAGIWHCIPPTSPPDKYLKGNTIGEFTYNDVDFPSEHLHDITFDAIDNRRYCLKVVISGNDERLERNDAIITLSGP